MNQISSQEPRSCLGGNLHQLKTTQLFECDFSLTTTWGSHNGSGGHCFLSTTHTLLRHFLGVKTWEKSPTFREIVNKIPLNTNGLQALTNKFGIFTSAQKGRGNSTCSWTSLLHLVRISKSESQVCFGKTRRNWVSLWKFVKGLQLAWV